MIIPQADFQVSLGTEGRTMVLEDNSALSGLLIGVGSSIVALLVTISTIVAIVCVCYCCYFRSKPPRKTKSSKCRNAVSPASGVLNSDKKLQDTVVISLDQSVHKALQALAESTNSSEEHIYSEPDEEEDRRKETGTVTLSLDWSVHNALQNMTDPDEEEDRRKETGTVTLSLDWSVHDALQNMTVAESIENTNYNRLDLSDSESSSFPPLPQRLYLRDKEFMTYSLSQTTRSTAA